MGFSVDDLIAACVAGAGERDSRGAVASVLREALADPTAVADAIRPEQAGITLLHHAPDVTVINVVWAPGMRIFPHDHRMWAVIGVYTGREDNEFFRRGAGTPALVPSNGRTLDAGDVLVLGDDTIHAVHNPSRGPTGAIHVYGGDFMNQPRSQWLPPALDEEPYDPAVVAETFAEANRVWLESSR